MMAVTQKDTTFTKIFVGGLPYHTTDESLRDFFKQFGDIDEAVVITDRQTAKSRGYGFVTMSEKPGAERACKDANPIIDGRKANVNLAYLGAKPRTMPLALKTGLSPTGILQTQYSLPQLIYSPTTTPYVAATNAPATAAFPAMSATQMSAATQMVDINGYPAGIHNMAGYEALQAQYANAYMAPVTAPTAYTYGVPQQLGIATPAAHYQPAQIQERMQ